MGSFCANEVLDKTKLASACCFRWVLCRWVSVDEWCSKLLRQGTYNYISIWLFITTWEIGVSYKVSLNYSSKIGGKKMANKSLCVRTLHPLFSMPHGKKQWSEFILKTKKQPLNVSQEVADFSSKADTRSWSIGWVLKNMPISGQCSNDGKHIYMNILRTTTSQTLETFPLPSLRNKQNTMSFFFNFHSWSTKKKSSSSSSSKTPSSSIISPFANLPALLFKILECSKSFLNRLTRLKSVVPPKKLDPKKSWKVKKGPELATTNKHVWVSEGSKSRSQ